MTGPVGFAASLREKLKPARPRGWERTRKRFVGLPSGPTAPAPVQLYRFIVEPERFLEECRFRFGPVFTIRLGIAPPIVQFSEPDAVREVFTGSGDLLHAGPANAILRPVLGENSVLLLDGARHMSQRRLLLPPFHGERMKAYAATMHEVAESVVQRWPLDRPYPAHAMTQAITIDVILRTVFGLEDGASMTELRDLLKATLDKAANPIFLALPVHLDLGDWTPWARVAKLHERVHARLQQEIDRARADSRPREDVLSLLVRARHEDGTPMADAEIRDELLTLLIAGHETTATALAWALHRLSIHRDVQARAHEEIDRVLGVTPEPERFRDLAFVDAIGKETMRLHPVVPGVGRRLMSPARIAGIDLPAGVFAGVSVYLAHRYPGTYENPQRFDPERFVTRKYSPYEYLPFGGGIRRCIGMAFAYEELRIVLGTILRSLEIEAVPGHVTRTTRRGITLVPTDGAMVIARRRTRRD